MTDQAKSVKDNWDIVLTDTNETKLMNLQIISYIPLALSVIFCVTHILPRGFLSVFHRLLNDSIDLDAESRSFWLWSLSYTETGGKYNIISAYVFGGYLIRRTLICNLSKFTPVPYSTKEL